MEEPKCEKERNKRKPISVHLQEAYQNLVQVFESSKVNTFEPQLEVSFQYLFLD
jgi:hypothetical protein